MVTSCSASLLGKGGATTGTEGLRVGEITLIVGSWGLQEAEEGERDMDSVWGSPPSSLYETNLAMVSPGL